LVLASSLSQASLIGDVLECIEARALRTEGRCGPIAEEALESVRLVESLADAMINRKEHRKATVLLGAALRKYPRNASLISRLSVAESYADEMEAIAARDRERKAAPNADEIAASMTRIRCTRMSGDVGLAACEAALAREPKDPALLAAKGDLLAADGRTADAVKAFTAALAASPTDVILRQKVALLSGRKDRPNAVTVTASPTPAPARDDKTGPPPVASVSSTAATPDVGGLEVRLATLQTLLTSGLITDAEFQARRRTLLDAFLSPLPQTAASQAGPKAPAAADKIPALDFGKYHALVIGIDKYRYLPVLETAHNDAKAVAAVLKDKYDYNVKLLLDPSREQIIEALDVLRETLTESDNVLIYYAGHGWLDKEADQGFWLPVDAKAERRSQWISNDTVRDLAKALTVKHMLVIADSCFSGTLTRGLTARPQLDADYLKRISSKRARQAMSSGGLEPVLDSVDGKHSPFARALVQILAENRSVIDGTTLFGDIRRPVALSSDQTPEFSDLRRAGHDGGDFLFVRRR
jgi:tetratricopeptide (TPR) repeat protein